MALVEKGCCLPINNSISAINDSPTRIVIFAKAPQPGKVKTRLMPALGADGACALAGALLEHTVEQAFAAGVNSVEICAAPEPHDALWCVWRNKVGLPTHLLDSIIWSEQGGGDLGARLACAVDRVVSDGEMVLLIGADCPSLTSMQLRVASNALREQAAVMVPATDGGYVLLGLRQSVPGFFAQINWSTSGVAAETRQRLKVNGLTWQEFQPLHDIDEPSDLRFLPDKLLSVAKDFLRGGLAGRQAEDAAELSSVTDC